MPSFFPFPFSGGFFSDWFNVEFSLHVEGDFLDLFESRVFPLLPWVFSEFLSPHLRLLFASWETSLVTELRAGRARWPRRRARGPDAQER